MKNLLFILTFVLIGSIAFAMSNSDANNESPSTTTECVEIVEAVPDCNSDSEPLFATTESIEIVEEALYCKVNCPDGSSHSCWFCSCSSLPDCGGEPDIAGTN